MPRPEGTLVVNTKTEQLEAVEITSSHSESPFIRPTPLLGSWADAWDSRQASEIIVEDPSKTNCDEQPSTVPLASAVLPPVPVAEGSPAKFQVTINCDSEKPAAISAHNPYYTDATYLPASHPIEGAEYCPCAECLRMYEMAAMNAPFPSPAASSSSNEMFMEPSSSVSDGVAAAQRASAEEVLSMPLLGQDEVTAQQWFAFENPEPIDPAALSVFMPPSPPQLISIDIWIRTGVPVEEAQDKFYHLMIRWYNKVCAVQTHFVGDQVCPPPDNSAYTFFDWASYAEQWWKFHFEHAQKPQPKVYRPRYGHYTKVPAPRH